MEAASVPVTVKMRLGWDHDTINAPELARRAEALGVQGGHGPRPHAAAILQGQGRLERHRSGRRGGRHPGRSPTAMSARSRTRGAACALPGASAVMIGRSAVGRPWLVGQIGAALQGATIPDPAPEEMIEIAVEHYEGLLSLYGEKVGIRHARKHLAAYADVALASGFQVARGRSRTALVTSEEPRIVDRLCCARSTAARTGRRHDGDGQSQRPHHERAAAAGSHRRAGAADRACECGGRIVLRDEPAHDAAPEAHGLHPVRLSGHGARRGRASARLQRQRAPRRHRQPAPRRRADRRRVRARRSATTATAWS